MLDWIDEIEQPMSVLSTPGTLSGLRYPYVLDLRMCLMVLGGQDEENDREPATRYANDGGLRREPISVERGTLLDLGVVERLGDVTLTASVSSAILTSRRRAPARGGRGRRRARGRGRRPAPASRRR